MTVVSRQSMTDDGGLFTTGTVVNKAFVDQVYDQVDDQCHSTTNPTVKPKAITDEVVAARGSKASLDARLDVSIEEDGTLKAGAQAVTQAQVKSLIGSVNVVKNGDLDDWSSGASAAPDDFTLSVITVARTATTLNAGQYMARLTRAGADGFLYQDIIAAADFANYSLIAELGLKFSFSLRVKCSTASQARITVDDGATTTNSSYHTGGGADETLTVTHTISGSATRLRIRIDVNNSNGDVDCGGFIAAFSDLTITSWKPLTLPALATATRRGIVNCNGAAQTIGAKVTFSLPPIALPTYARCTATLTKNNSTAFSDITGLAFAVGANEVWEFAFVVHLVSAVAAGFKMTLTGPAAPTALRFGIISGTGTPGSATAFSSAVNAASNANDQVFMVSGLLRNGANAGTVQLQGAQNAADPTDTKFYIESHVRAFRIS